MELVLPELDVKKSGTWNFHEDDLQKNSRYDMIIGRDLLLELKLDLCLYNCTIKINGGVYKVCTVSMQYNSDLRDGAILRNEEWWESEHVLDSKQRTRRIFYAQYQKPI